MSHPQDLSLVRQAELIACGDLDPRELLRATLERITSRNPDLNAVCGRFDTRAEEMLEKAPRGPLHGVPVTVKDMFCLPWWAPTDGSGHPRMSAGESGVHRRLRDAGAVVVGVCNMHLYGAGTTGTASAYGPMANPWDLRLCAGGSSGGSAASVAAWMVAGSVGTDGAGSVRIPSSYCATTGLKPTFGLVPVDGYTHGFSTMGVVGPIARDADDTRLLASALLGRELSAAQPAAKLRAGLVRTPFWDDLDPEVERACRAALAQTGWQLTELELDGTEHTLICAVLRLSLEGLPAIDAQELEAADPLVRAVFKYQLTLPARFLVRADRVRSLLRRSLARAFEHCDLLAWPTVPAPAPRLDDTSVELPSGRIAADPANVAHTGLANLAGTPAMSVPVGLHANTAPIGLELQAAWGQDALLCEAARHIEEVTGRAFVEVTAPVAAGP